MKENLIGLSDRIWANPETRYKEYKAYSWLSSFLETNGFTVERSIGGLDTSFVARRMFGDKGTHIAYLAEYDALPDIGHACGHNIIGVSSSGAAVAVANTLEAAKKPATISVYGCPAEEGGGGKVYMAKAGLFSDVDIMLMVHPGDCNKAGAPSNASSRLFCRFYGKAAHGAGNPHKGISALDAVIQTFNMMNGLRQTVPEDVRLMGIITNGGQVVNVIPEFAECQFSIRAARLDTLESVIARLKKCAEAAALATGARLKMEEPDHFPHYPVRPNPTLNRIFEDNLRELRAPVSPVSPSRGSTDFGNASWMAPGLHGYVAVVPKGTPGHSVEMRDACGSDSGHQGLLLAAKALAMSGIDLIYQQEQIEQAWNDFHSLAE